MSRPVVNDIESPKPSFAPSVSVSRSLIGTAMRPKPSESPRSHTSSNVRTTVPSAPRVNVIFGSLSLR